MRKIALVISIALLSGCALFKHKDGGESSIYGKYIGTVEAQWLDDGRRMKLLKPLTFIDPASVEWVAPEGWIVDGASIPQFAWTIIGGPFEGKYRNASVIHDVACDQKARSWQSVHDVFYNAMRASGVDNEKAKVMYAAVYHFGPRWSLQPGPTGAAAMARTVPQSAFDQLRAEIERREKAGEAPMSLEEIKAFKP